MDLFKVFGVNKQNGNDDLFDATGEYIGDDWDEADPHWDAVASAGADHTWAMDQGWGGTEPNEDDFHPETGEQTGASNSAHHVKEWANNLQTKYKTPLVTDLGEPNADIYSHHGLNEEPIDHSHITNYLQAKTGKTEIFPGSVVDKMLRKIFKLNKGNVQSSNYGGGSFVARGGGSHRPSSEEEDDRHPSSGYDSEAPENQEPEDEGDGE